MDLILNNEPISSTDGISLEQLLHERNISPTGIAIGVNNRVIKRTDWATQTLSQGDKITIIRATCGG